MNTNIALVEPEEVLLVAQFFKLIYDDARDDQRHVKLVASCDIDHEIGDILHFFYRWMAGEKADDLCHLVSIEEVAVEDGGIGFMIYEPGEN